MSYEERSAAAKRDFIEALRGCPEANNRNGEFAVNHIASKVGMSPPTVSKFLKEPDRISENFIRLVSASARGMELAYAMYRLHVDQEYVPFALYQDALARATRASQLSRALADMESALEDHRARVLRAMASMEALEESGRMAE